jgi:hypothetical protein
MLAHRLLLICCGSALLALDIVEAILGGWADQRMMLEKLERPLPVGWEEQRAALIGVSDNG